MDPWKVISCEEKNVKIGLGQEEKLGDQITKNLNTELKDSGSEILDNLVSPALDNNIIVQTQPDPVLSTVLHNDLPSPLSTNSEFHEDLVSSSTPEQNPPLSVCSFDDHFQPNPSNFSKLPDSEEYLASLGT